MAERGRGRRIGLTLAVLLTACGRPDGGAPGGGLQISFEDRAEPAAFTREGPAVRDRPDGAEGLWAAVRGLPRPQRARSDQPCKRRHRGGGALRRRRQPGIRLSNAAADALGTAKRRSWCG